MIVTLEHVLSFLIAYLIGSISGSMFVSKFLFKEDIRSMGSGNAGTTNIYRAYGFRYAAISGAIDVLKAIVALLIVRTFLQNDTSGMYSIYIASVAVVIGHIWPIYFGFKGGKGMATSIGVNIYHDVIVVLIQVFELVAINYIFKIMSLTSIIMTITSIIYFMIFSNDKAMIYVSIINGIIVIYSHRSNIKRMLEGNENKIERLKGRKWKFQY